MDKAHKQRAKKSKRSQTKYASLQKKFHNLNVHEYLDYDYVTQLTDKEKEFLNKFSEEYYRAYFKKDAKKHLHKKKDRKSVYASNNARNRDLYSEARKKGQLDLFGETSPSTGLAKAAEYEDELIEFLDASKED